jgi:hypothetical protein
MILKGFNLFLFKWRKVVFRMKWSIVLIAAVLLAFCFGVFDVDPAVAGETDLVWSSFLGGSGSEEGNGDLAIDNLGNVYVSGTTSSEDFPLTAGAVDDSMSTIEAFVAKLDASGSAMIYCTYLGGRNTDAGYGITVDADGCAYLTGLTDSFDFPITPDAFDTSFNDTPYPPWPYFDAFLTKLNPSGDVLVYSTFLGGAEVDDGGQAVVVDENGSAYLTGGTGGADFPATPEAYDTTYNGGDWAGDVFVAKFDPTGSDLEYCTYLGGINEEYGYDIDIDADGCAYVTGRTVSSTFPTTAGAFDPIYNQGGDAFVTKMNAAGSGLVYSTFIGGIAGEMGWGIAVDGLARAYVVGETESSDFPVTPDAFDESYNANVDAFVAKINGPGSKLDFCTYLGGKGEDHAWGVALDDENDLYIIGQTTSNNFPTTTDGYDLTYNGATDAYLVKLNSVGDSLAYGTYFGAAGDDWGAFGIAVDGDQVVSIMGGTVCSNFPVTPGAFDVSFNGEIDDWVAKFDLGDGSVPVVLMSFQAQAHPGGIELQWTTASEVDCHRWEIFRVQGGGTEDELPEDGRFVKIGQLPGHGSTEIAHTYRWVDRNVLPEVTYDYKLQQIDLNGSATWSEVVSATAGAAVPADFVLQQNYPNPFNPATEIGYAVPRDVHVTVRIYNIQGAEVATLVDADQPAGFHTVEWNAGALGSGVYFCRLQAGGVERTIKMALVK